MRSKSFARRVVEWKAGHYPEENVLQVASALHDFVGINSSYVLEVTSTLNTPKNRFIELEIELRNVKDKFTIDSHKAVKVVDSLNT
jgi:hypothetical protein